MTNTNDKVTLNKEEFRKIAAEATSEVEKDLDVGGGNSSHGYSINS